MKNRLFLTSMLAVMIACPAFGVSSLVPDPTEETQSGYIPDGDQSADCKENPLTYRGTSNSYGTYTLTAQWEADECTITLDKNGGVLDSSPTILYTRYCGDNACTGGAYLENARTNLMTTSTNPLTDAPEGQNVTMSVYQNQPGVSSETPVTSTHRKPFTGFYATSAATGDPYIDNDTLRITSAGNNAAKGVAKDNNGDCPDTTWYAGWGCYQEATPDTPTNNNGYVFAGWYDAATGGNQVTNWCIDSDTNVYAHWACNINYNATAHSATPSATANNSATYGSAYNMPSVSSVSAAADGYTFVGWTTDSNPSVTRTGATAGTVANSWTWTNGTNWTEETCPTNLYAAYIANQYTVTYKCNGGTIDSSLVDSAADNVGTDTVTYGTPYTFVTQADLCSYSNQTPSGWSCNISSTPWFEEQNWDVTDNVICEAQWNNTPYTITYTCGSLPNNGGTVGGTLTNNTDTVYNGTQNYQLRTSANGCGMDHQLDGYHFAGWTCTPNLATGSSSATYSVNWPSSTIVSETIETIGISSNATCEAVWAKDMVDLIYLETPGDETAYANGSCNYGGNGSDGAFNLPNNPTKTGYTFTGWKITDWSSNQSNVGD